MSKLFLGLLSYALALPVWGLGDLFILFEAFSFPRGERAGITHGRPLSVVASVFLAGRGGQRGVQLHLSSFVEKESGAGA